MLYHFSSEININAFLKFYVSIPIKVITLYFHKLLIMIFGLETSYPELLLVLAAIFELTRCSSIHSLPNSNTWGHVSKNV